MKKNILVFPCGSEIALELYSALEHSIHFNLIGANSIDDHGKFVYKNYIGNVPCISDKNFLPAIKEVLKQQHIDALYPAMDSVIEILKRNEDYLDCKVIASCTATAQLCLSKSKTYNFFKGKIKVPYVYASSLDVKKFPIFVKPDIGYGARGSKKITCVAELDVQLQEYPASIICEYLPGKEYTVDCFSDKSRQLLVTLPRERSRIQNGISVNTKPVEQNLTRFIVMAKKINELLELRGAWFFQVKEDTSGELTLLEIASRFGGSSGLFRAWGTNFPSMTLFDAFDMPLSVLKNNYPIEMDRALDNIYKLDISYNEIFIDFDDCIYLDSKYINPDAIAFLYKSINAGKKITLLSKHDDTNAPLNDLLTSLRIKQIFDRIIHIAPTENKYDFIDNKAAIFIDDSFAERKAVKQNCGLNVFGLDMIKML